jgi:hypothetical protein
VYTAPALSLHTRFANCAVLGGTDLAIRISISKSEVRIRISISYLVPLGKSVNHPVGEMVPYGSWNLEQEVRKMVERANICTTKRGRKSFLCNKKNV